MHHFMTDTGEQPPNFAILAFGHHDFDQRAHPLLLDDSQVTNAELPFGEEEALPQLIECPRFWFSGDHRPVDPLDLKLGMGQPMGQFAIVGDENQPLGVFIESTHGKESRVARRDQIDHTAAARGIGRRAEKPGRFVDEVIDLFGDFEFLAVDRNLLDLGIHLRPQRSHDPVDGHPPGCDQFLTGTARTETSGGEELLQAFA